MFVLFRQIVNSCLEQTETFQSEALGSCHVSETKSKYRQLFIEYPNTGLHRLSGLTTPRCELWSFFTVWLWTVDNNKVSLSRSKEALVVWLVSIYSLNYEHFYLSSKSQRSVSFYKIKIICWDIDGMGGGVLICKSQLSQIKLLSSNKHEC